jgi:hypothetical protein
LYLIDGSKMGLGRVIFVIIIMRCDVPVSFWGVANVAFLDRNLQLSVQHTSCMRTPKFE